MPRHLKTQYPCKACGVPCQVRYRSAAEWVKCERCRHRESAFYLINAKEEAAFKESDLGNAAAENGDERAAFLHWLRAISCWLEAAARRLDPKANAVQRAEVTPAEARKLALDAVRYASQARDLLGEIAAWGETVREEAKGVAVLAGGGERSPIAAPVLRLVPTSDD